jgi:phage terminase large subunit-like protein
MVCNAGNDPKPKPCRVSQYVAGVADGSIPACKWVRLACQRHANDLRKSDEQWRAGTIPDIWFDQESADHAIDFFAFLKHSKGRWSKARFDLSPWQQFIVGSLFGWRRADGTRRFRIAFVEVPRKNGKTTLAAGIGLYLFVCDGEAGAEIYSAATKRDQAKLVFEDAKALVRSCPGLLKRIESYRYSLQIPATRSVFQPLGADGDTLDGLNPFVAICDEIHAWKSRDLWDVLLTGMGAREQPLALAITTAGDFSDSIYNELRTDAEQILEAVGQTDGIKDDAVFAFMATIDAEDDWTDEAAWGKANPNLGVSLKMDELREVIERAKRQPASQNKTKRNRLGIRTQSLNAWLRLDWWDKGSAPFDEAELLGKPCWGGLDLASRNDLNAFALVFPWGETRGRPCYRLKVWIWCPGDAEEYAAQKLRKKLFPWAPKYITFTDGQTSDYPLIESTILQASKDYDLKAVAFDPWNAESTAQNLSAAGLQVFKFNQNTRSYNEPSCHFERAVIDGRLFHNGNPVLRWMASNATVAMNGEGLIMPSKRNSRDKIDGIPASVMALGCLLRVPDKDETSIYETQGFDA